MNLLDEESFKSSRTHSSVSDGMKIKEETNLEVAEDE